MTDQRGYSRPSSQARPQQQTRTQQQAPRQQMPPLAGAGKNAPTVIPKQKLFEKFGNKFGIDQDVLIETLKNTAFKTKVGDPAVTNEQLVALLIVADQYGLNPFTKEIYAYPDKNNGIVPVVSVDGWLRIINEHPQFDGFDLTNSEGIAVSEKNEHRPCFEWMEVTIYRKDRSHAVPIREYFDEVYRPPFKGTGQNGAYTINGPWQTHPKRLHRHKTLIQGGRVVFGFAGIYDEDEATRIIEATEGSVVHTIEAQTRVDGAKEALRQRMGQPAKPATEAAQKPAQQPQQPAAKQAEPSDELPWDTKATPQTKEQWIAAFKACKTLDAVNVLWDSCVDFFDEKHTDVDTDIQATMEVCQETFLPPN